MVVAVAKPRAVPAAVEVVVETGVGLGLGEAGSTCGPWKSAKSASKLSSPSVSAPSSRALTPASGASSLPASSQLRGKLTTARAPCLRHASSSWASAAAT